MTRTATRASSGVKRAKVGLGADGREGPRVDRRAVADVIEAHAHAASASSQARACDRQAARTGRRRRGRCARDRNDPSRPTSVIGAARGCAQPFAQPGHVQETARAQVASEPCGVASAHRHWSRAHAGVPGARHIRAAADRAGSTISRAPHMRVRRHRSGHDATTVITAPWRHPQLPSPNALGNIREHRQRRRAHRPERQPDAERPVALRGISHTTDRSRRPFSLGLIMREHASGEASAVIHRPARSIAEQSQAPTGDRRQQPRRRHTASKTRSGNDPAHRRRPHPDRAATSPSGSTPPPSTEMPNFAGNAVSRSSATSMSSSAVAIARCRAPSQVVVRQRRDEHVAAALAPRHPRRKSGLEPSPPRSGDAVGVRQPTHLQISPGSSARARHCRSGADPADDTRAAASRVSVAHARLDPDEQPVAARHRLEQAWTPAAPACRHHAISTDRGSMRRRCGAAATARDAAHRESAPPSPHAPRDWHRAGTRPRAASPSVASNTRSNCRSNRVGNVAAKRVQSLQPARDLGGAAIAVPHHAGDPGRSCQRARAPPARSPRRSKRVRGANRHRRIRVIQRRRAAERAAAAAKPPSWAANSTPSSRSISRVILLCTNASARADQRAETRRRRSRRHRPAHRRTPTPRDTPRPASSRLCPCRRVAAARRRRRRSCPAPDRRSRRGAAQRSPSSPTRGVPTVPVAASSRAAIARTASSNSAICAANASRNRPDIRSVTSTRGRSSTASGKISMPVTRAEPPVPNRPRAEQHQRQREILAAGAHRGAAPEIEHQRARILAVILQMPPAEYPRRRSCRERHARARRHAARIDGGEVAPRRQHVRPAARRRAGRTGRHETRRPAPRAAPRAPRPQADRRASQCRRVRSRGDARRNESSKQRVAPFGGGCTAEHVQPVADLQILDVAEIRVEPRERVVLRRAGRDPRLVGQAECRRRDPGFRAAARVVRRASRPSAAAYSSISRSSSTTAPSAPALRNGGVRCPIVTAPSRRFAHRRLARDY